MKKLTNLAVLFSLIIFTSCSNNDEGEIIDKIKEEELSEVMEDFQKKIESIEVPNALRENSDVNAQQTETYFNLIKNYGITFSSFFTIPENASFENNSVVGRGTFTGNSETYTWSSGNTTINYTITELVDRYTFIYKIVSPDFTGKLLDGYSLKDGSYAELNLIDPSNSNLSLSLKWTYTENMSKVEINIDSNKFLLESNKDNSGNIKVYENGALSSECKWNADGSGSLINYVTGESYTW